MLEHISQLNGSMEDIIAWSNIFEMYSDVHILTIVSFAWSCHVDAMFYSRYAIPYLKMSPNWTVRANKGWWYRNRNHVLQNANQVKSLPRTWLMKCTMLA